MHALLVNRSGDPTVPLVTVGMPVHNAERDVAKAIESVLMQTLGNFELIVSDNASTDKTAEIVSRYMRDDPRLFYRRFDTNRGVAFNWNSAALGARGRYFKWLAGSDEMTPGLLAQCAEVLETRPDAVLAFGRTRWIDASGQPLLLCDQDFAVLSDRPAERFTQVARDMSINNQINAGLIRTAALRKTRLLGNYPSSDLVLMAELALQGKVILLPQELFRRRTGADVSTPQRSPLEVARHYNPGAARPRRFVSLRRQVARYAACLRAPLPAAERARALIAATGLLYAAWVRRQNRLRDWLLMLPTRLKA
jgi:glycosyltransferase involved in cell wall biosynthesis